MIIAFPFSQSSAGYLNSMKKAFLENGFKSIGLPKFISPFRLKILRKFSSDTIFHEKYIICYNNYVIQSLRSNQIEYFFNYSGGNLLPETIRYIRDNLKCKTICFIGDNPFDPLPKRDKYFAMGLRYYDILLSPEPTWDKLIKNVAPKSKIIRFYGGYEPDYFFPVSKSEISDEDIKKFSCDISFTGGSYGSSPEGSYRAGILGLLEDYNLKLWGDNRWNWRYKYYPNIEKAHSGTRLSYAELRKQYRLAKISLNIPSPMLTRGFQPRIFEIAAAKGFQIVDHTDELYNFYERDEVVTFKDPFDLKEKLDYYLNHPEERSLIVNKMYNKTVDSYSWTNQIKLVINEI